MSVRTRYDYGAQAWYFELTSLMTVSEPEFSTEHDARHAGEHAEQMAARTDSVSTYRTEQRLVYAERLRLAINGKMEKHAVNALLSALLADMYGAKKRPAG